jgi:hypothetical protein
MKTIKGLDRKIQQTFGEDNELPAEIQNQAPTLRRLLLNQMGNTKGRDGTDSVEILHIGMKIRSGFKADNSTAKDEVDLEDAEFKKLHEACDKMTGVQWPALFHGQVMEALEEAKKS